MQICMAHPPGCLTFSVHVCHWQADASFQMKSGFFYCLSEAVILLASTCNCTVACRRLHCRNSLCQGLAAARQEDESYLVGCDDGLVVRCSTAYDSDYLAAYGDDTKDSGHSLEASALPASPRGPAPLRM